MPPSVRRPDATVALLTKADQDVDRASTTRSRDPGRDVERTADSASSIRHDRRAAARAVIGPRGLTCRMTIVCGDSTLDAWRFGAGFRHGTSESSMCWHATLIQRPAKNMRVWSRAACLGVTARRDLAIIESSAPRGTGMCRICGAPSRMTMEGA